jgi:predicted component of type VI protein secretion system
MQYCGTEVSPSEVVVNDVDTVHQSWFHPLAQGQDLCVGDEIVRRGRSREGRYR